MYLGAVHVSATPFLATWPSSSSLPLSESDPKKRTRRALDQTVLGVVGGGGGGSLG